MCAVSDRLLAFLVYGNLSFLVCDLHVLFKRQSSSGGGGSLYITPSLESVQTEMFHLHVRLDLNEASKL